ncbi:hypothetical protein OK18_00525 [Chryseobacterium gallinarum]|uniref:DUF333 domain-containing protein n=1 Tax=Chryseobacterium gallinarum TaxID=1324352 RepID=A0A0G3LY59_CHRGL|nr:DUF6520 family protein [Chryseobacterium gallinarum]AKK71320.1 hypothetical protein OK18_00525 [Chryseobacterium gallinarum]
MKKLLLPGLIVAMGFGGAFATSKMKTAMPTYRINGSHCDVVQQECDENPGELCTWSVDGSQLYKFRSADETTCSQELRRSIQ